MGDGLQPCPKREKIPDINPMDKTHANQLREKQ
jgi:hypothetical protein